MIRNFNLGDFMSQNILGNRIREERQKLHLTQAQLAEKLNVSTTYIGYVERGERSLTLEKLTLLANLLGVSIDYLLSDIVTPPPSSNEKLLLSLFSSASEEEQTLIIEMTKLILNHKNDQK